MRIVCSPFCRFSGDEQLPSPEQMKEDLARCPPWILNRLRSEREMRRNLADQTAEQTEALSLEVTEWRNKAFLYKSQKDELELEVASKNEEIERLKDVAKKAVTNLREDLRKKDDELKKKGEILEMLKQRWQQQMGQNSNLAPLVGTNPAPQVPVPAGRPLGYSSPSVSARRFVESDPHSVLTIPQSTALLLPDR